MYTNSLSKRLACVDPSPTDTLTDRMNLALNTSGAGFVLSLCPATQYNITAPLVFAFPNQEVSTAGYPKGNDRATLVVSGAISNGIGHTTAVNGTCQFCNGVKLRNVQINGSRNGPIANGGANIEMGGANSGQLIEYVRSYAPRSWSCLHVTEGSGLQCHNITVQNNDIGPCGTDDFQQWADGISFSCANGMVRNNIVNDPTDGGIVLFGSPGTTVQNNTIWIDQRTLLGGINLVDYEPWKGNYTGVVVQNNTILGGFATDQNGSNAFNAIIKIGIAIGPRTWFGNKYGKHKSVSANVVNNRLSGAFGYGIAVSSASNFTIENNALFGGTRFIGSRGPNCSSVAPATHNFTIDRNTTHNITLQAGFAEVLDGDSLTCIVPPNGGNFWPVPSQLSSGSSSQSKASRIGIVVGIVLGVPLVAIVAWLLRKWALRRRAWSVVIDQTGQPLTPIKGET